MSKHQNFCLGKTSKRCLTVQNQVHFVLLLFFSEINIIPPKHRPAKPIRQIKAGDIGSLVKVRGIVTRITEVRPFVQVATYVCSQCGCELFQPVTRSSV